MFSDPSKSDISAASSEPPQVKIPFTEESLDFTIEYMIEAIEEVHQNSASGPDEVPAVLLRNLKNYLAVLIDLICSHSMDQMTLSVVFNMVLIRL